ncbi:putative glycosyltransferase EpsH [Flavobacterium sp. ACN2]|jgi:glycosyltransferase involved in cell wall biosynthesis|uniref:glycosyltransferase family 2 protein n=1 Tax=unclassified Flavobacterium TaxID=196869 RepID=UPI000BB3557D|nr:MULTISPECIES: glycosyltransferase family A protein [unclassified Flavobacterium]MDY0987398.1 glycosyltransferase family A protein [Flavobacterium sp. CFBP9031]PBI84151.1 putative glycosyltransferase EpsH [Flavobacterium sp. ACN2]
MKNIVTISAVVPIYNSQKTIAKCLESILSQTENVNEIIIVDDGSVDRSVAIANEVLKSVHGIMIVLVEQENAGPSAARNKGVSLATSSHIAFLDSDDIWSPDHIRNVKEFFQENDSFKIVATKYLGAPISYVGEIFLKKMLYKNYFLTPCVVLKKDVFFEVGGFNEEMSFAEDYFLWLSIISNNRGYLLDYVGAANVDDKKVFGQNGLSSNLRLMHEGVLQCYKNLYSNKLINYKTYIKIIFFEKIKYLRRIIISCVVKNELS